MRKQTQFQPTWRTPVSTFGLGKRGECWEWGGPGRLPGRGGVWFSNLQRGGASRQEPGPLSLDSTVMAFLELKRDPLPLQEARAFGLPDTQVTLLRLLWTRCSRYTDGARPQFVLGGLTPYPLGSRSHTPPLSLLPSLLSKPHGFKPQDTGWVSL